MPLRATACQQCRDSKRRCNRLEGCRACSACRSRGLSCSHVVKQQRSLSIQLAPQPAKSLLTHATEVELVNNYFIFIHERPHSIFHEPTLRELANSRTVDDALLLAVCAMGCRFSANADHRALEEQLTMASKTLFLSKLETVTISAIQTCILLANLCAATLNTDGELLYFGIGLRMAQRLNLLSLDPSDTPIHRETKHRIWYTLQMADIWCSWGSNLPRQLRDSENDIDLPIDEVTFHDPHFGSSRVLLPPKLGLWAYRIMLVRIFSQIQDLNHRIVSKGLSREHVDQEAHQIALQLKNWEESLPEQVKFTDTNVAEYCQKGFGGAFLDLHLGFHHYSTLLFFNYLDSRADNPYDTWKYSALCKMHATRYAEILRLSRSEAHCSAVHALVGHMTVVCSAVLLHALLFGNEVESASARVNLLSNFEILTTLKKYWPSLDTLISRLFTFQNSCLRSKSSETHKVDGWMVRFLFEYALPLGTKAENSDSTEDYMYDPSSSYSIINSDLSDRYQISMEMLGTFSIAGR